MAIVERNGRIVAVTPSEKTVPREEVRSCLEYLAYQGRSGAGKMADVAQAILDKWRDENLESSPQAKLDHIKHLISIYDQSEEEEAGGMLAIILSVIDGTYGQVSVGPSDFERRVSELEKRPHPGSRQ